MLVLISNTFHGMLSNEIVEQFNFRIICKKCLGNTNSNTNKIDTVDSIMRKN